MKTYNLEIGAGNSHSEGYIHTDINAINGHHLEVICRGEELSFKDKVLDKIMLQGVFEHFTRQGAFSLLSECKRVLKPGGLLELTAPDLLTACKIIVDNELPFDDEQDRPPRDYALSCLYGGQDRTGQVHQWGWTKISLEVLLLSFNFTIETFNQDVYEPFTHLHFIAKSGVAQNENR